MTSTLDFENTCTEADVPAEESFVLWIDRTLEHAGDFDKPVNVGIRIVDEAESAMLNRDYRGKDYSTNVLSFSSHLPEAVQASLDEIPLGDLVICADVVKREAREQDKAPADHWAHMVVHGMLHLNGFDHEDDVEAEQMESLERKILATLDIADPYEDEQH